MTHRPPTLDSHAYITLLMASGFTEAQATLVVQLLIEAITLRWTDETKTLEENLLKEVKKMEARFQREIKELQLNCQRHYLELEQIRTARHQNGEK
ncbi:MAG: hypothetical protein G8237_11805 [Magnetococcales bacterium]|nr:hypothetical protein [Magnetococcales bacterium]